MDCIIYDWQKNETVIYKNIWRDNETMKFDFVIGNPPYQEASRGNNSNDTPVYNYFLDESYKVSDKVEMIHPARFLFNAGGTPAKWNEKMLEDIHLKIEMFTQKSSEIFANTDIKGGVAIT